MRELALELCDKFYVLPLDIYTYKPLLSWGVDGRRPVDSDINAWWDRYPSAMVGIICSRNNGIFGIKYKENNKQVKDFSKVVIYDKQEKEIILLYGIDHSSIKRLPTSCEIKKGVYFLGEGEIVPYPASAMDNRYQFKSIPSAVSNLKSLLRDSVGLLSKDTYSAIKEESRKVNKAYQDKMYFGQYGTTREEEEVVE